MKHYHLMEYINIIHDKDETDTINDQHSKTRHFEYKYGND